VPVIYLTVVAAFAVKCPCLSGKLSLFEYTVPFRWPHN